MRRVLVMLVISGSGSLGLAAYKDPSWSSLLIKPYWLFNLSIFWYKISSATTGCRVGHFCCYFSKLMMTLWVLSNTWGSIGLKL